MKVEEDGARKASFVAAWVREGPDGGRAGEDAARQLGEAEADAAVLADEVAAAQGELRRESVRGLGERGDDGAGGPDDGAEGGIAHVVERHAALGADERHLVGPDGGEGGERRRSGDDERLVDE